MNDLGSSSLRLKLTNTCMMQLPHNAAAAFLQGHASEPNDFHRKWQCFKVKWKSIPTIYRRVMMFWGQGQPCHIHPFLRVNSQLVLLSIVVSLTPLINPHILFYFREKKEGWEREREKHPLVDSCTLAHQGSTHNLGIKPPPFGAQDDAPTNSAAPARASHCSYHLLLGILPLWCLLHEESSRV